MLDHLPETPAPSVRNRFRTQTQVEYTPEPKWGIEGVGVKCARGDDANRAFRTDPFSTQHQLSDLIDGEACLDEPTSRGSLEFARVRLEEPGLLPTLSFGSTETGTNASTFQNLFLGSKA